MVTTPVIPPTQVPPAGSPISPQPRYTPLRFQGSAHSYGWPDSLRAPYQPSDVPAGRLDQYNTAYEWFKYSEKMTTGKFTTSNPPFSSDAAGRLLNALQYPGGQTPRILRGFIRRSEYDTTDVMSTSRLYFMFNPSVISRDYVSYLDQGALDPFNTVFQSNNLVAPPSMMNFTFELFFDRQDEAQDLDNPGVMVDMEMFDMVVRNVIPDPALQSMPDNGVMMVNPRDITVIFSPEITIQGRPLNASVIYEKFTHRMVPTRMRVQLTMRVIYWGPMRDMTTYTSDAEEAASFSRVSFTASTPAAYTFTLNDVEMTATGEKVQAIIDTQLGFISAANTANNAGDGSALSHAIAQWQKYSTIYSKNDRNNLWTAADCSSFVWGGFAGVGQATAMGWPAAGKDPVKIGLGVGIPSVATMFTGFVKSTAVEKIWGWNGDDDKDAGTKKMQVGDLLIRNMGGDGGDNHIAWVSKIDSSGVQCFHAKSTKNDVGYSDYKYPLSSNKDFRYTQGVRPLGLGGQSSAVQNNDQSRA